MSRHRLALAAVLLVAVPLSAADKKKKSAAAPAAVIDSDKLAAGAFVGRIVNPPETDGTFTVEVVSPALNAGGGASAKVAQDQIALQQQLARVQRDLRTRNRNASRDLSRLRSLQAKLVRDSQASATGVRVEFRAAPNAKVRLREPVAVFDEKGNIKKFTPAELAKLRGKDANLPGFEGTLADLRPGQIVRVSQVNQARAAADVDKALGPAKQKLVTMIVVLGEAPQAVGPAKKTNKK